MTDTTHTLPELPGHPEPHTFTWTTAERRAIESYGHACAKAALEFAALIPDRPAEQPQEAVAHIRYVAIEADPHASDKYGGRHPNDKEPRSDALVQVFRKMGDNEGQGLSLYWKWAFAAGWNARAAAPQPPQQVQEGVVPLQAQSWPGTAIEALTDAGDADKRDMKSLIETALGALRKLRDAAQQPAVVKAGAIPPDLLMVPNGPWVPMPNEQQADAIALLREVRESADFTGGVQMEPGWFEPSDLARRVDAFLATTVGEAKA